MLPKKGIVFPKVEKLKWPPERAYLRVGEIDVAEFGQSAVSPCTFKGPNNQPISSILGSRTGGYLRTRNAE
jgi:hypothetical protein